MRIRKIQLGVLLGGAAVSQLAFATGLEKSVGWSGHYAGDAYSAVTGVNDSQALFFNPADLAGTAGSNISGNVSALIPRFQAPLPTANNTLSSNQPLTPLYGVFAGYGFTDKLAVGVGTYISGGTRADYGNVDYTSAGFSGFDPAIKSKLTIAEYSIGGAYEVIDGLKFGAAWRILRATGSLGFTSGTIPGAALGVTGTAISGYDFENISATRYNGFRLGADYSPKGSNWGVGAQWRSEVRFTASSSTTVTTAGAGGTAVGLAGTSSTLNSTLGAALPQEIQIGGHYDIMPNFRVSAQYDWQQYAVDSNLGVGGVPVLATAAGAAAGNLNLPLAWANVNIYRIALDYGINSQWAVRAGFALTGQSTGNANAQAIFSSPGDGDTITAGTSYQLAQNISLDGAFEYSWASGSSTANAALPSVLAGTYATRDITVDLGATYRF